MNKYLPLMFLFALIALGVWTPEAHASAGPGLPWENPLATLVDSFRSPVAFAISVICI